LEDRLVPATLYWDGSSNNSWATVANWSTTIGGGSTPAAVPGSGDDVVFNATTVGTKIGTLGGNQSAHSVTFSANSTSAITLANNTLTVGDGGILVASGAAAHTIGSAIVLGAAETWTNASGSLLTVSGAVDTWGRPDRRGRRQQKAVGGRVRGRQAR
jgi:hypothetical protein